MYSAFELIFSVFAADVKTIALGLMWFGNVI